MTLDQYLNGDDIRVPASLRDRINRAGFSDAVDETTYLIWFRIYCENIEFKEEFSVVSTRHFRRMGLAPDTVTKCKEWLETNGFITTKRYPKGHEFEGNPIKEFGVDKETGKRTGKKAQSYRVNKHEEELVPIVLEKKSLLDALRRYTDDHPLSEYSKECQNNLFVKLDAVDVFLNEIDDKLPLIGSELSKKQLRGNKAKRVRTQNTLRAFHHGLGYCHKGHKCDRLFSGWTASPKISRKLLLLDGSAMVGLDLQASQPTLLACLLKDDALLEACYLNTLYQGVMEVTRTERDEAKEYFCWVLYGPLDLRWNKKRTRAEKAMAIKVQKHLQENYPVAFDKITDRKKKQGHSGFAIEMMNAEARIFIDGIYAEMSTLEIPSLLCHDALYVPQHWSTKATEIMLKHLELAMPNKKFTINKE